MALRSGKEGIPYERVLWIGIMFSIYFLAKTAKEAYPRQASTIRGMYYASRAMFVAAFIQYLWSAFILVGRSDYDDINLQVVAVAILQPNAF
jgi:hypothetical protein